MSSAELTLGTAAGCPSAEALVAFIASRADAPQVAGHLEACENCMLAVACLEAPDTTLRERTPRALPERVGRFRVLRSLGSGGMGDVLVARDPELDREVALKLLRTRAQGRSWRDEGRAVARVHHPAVVSVFEAGTHEGVTFLAMELVKGETFRSWSRDERVTLRDRLEVLLEAGEGLAAAHAQGVVHCDFKPANLLVDARRRARVIDFGLARPPGTGAEAGEAMRSPEGTPTYMAPEQLRGGAVSPQTDQFSFCVTLYEAVLRRRLRVDEITPEAAGTPEFERVARTVPRWLRPVLQRGLSTDPGARYPSMAALLAEIRRRAPRPHRAARPLVLAAAALVAAAALGALAGTALASHLGSHSPAASVSAK
ncbi:MAG: serine/threonine protein kinase [Myxococcaceae bacterium]|nr:serine/threonine protein kinase [Myxococcaceae bacterium]